MISHTAKSLFEKNIKSAKDCLSLYHAVEKMKPQNVNAKWLLRAAIVFTVSALDAYFHDKIKYRIGRLSLQKLPPELAKLKIKVGDLQTWDKAKRKRNVLRNLVTRELSVKSLQSPDAIADALKLVGILSFWNEIMPNNGNKEHLRKTLDKLFKRRHQISHEGDRLAHRGSRKRLRKISSSYVDHRINIAVTLVDRVEKLFPD